MALKLITPASTYPVTLAEVKLHCRVDASDEDALIQGLIAAATEMAEQETGRALMTQTWEVSQDAFDSTGIVLTRTPVASITSIKYFDTDGVEQTLSSALYAIAQDDFGYATVLPVYGSTWPDTQDRSDAVTVRYVAGYATVPESIKQWIKLLISTMYDNRETESYSSRAVSTTVKMQFVDRLLDRYRIFPI